MKRVNNGMSRTVGKKELLLERRVQNTTQRETHDKLHRQSGSRVLCSTGAYEDHASCNGKTVRSLRWTVRVRLALNTLCVKDVKDLRLVRREQEPLLCCKLRAWRCCTHKHHTKPCGLEIRGTLSSGVAEGVRCE